MQFCGRFPSFRPRALANGGQVLPRVPHTYERQTCFCCSAVSKSTEERIRSSTLAPTISYKNQEDDEFLQLESAAAEGNRSFVLPVTLSEVVEFHIESNDLTLPMIDLSIPDNVAAYRIKMALKSHGMFYVKNFGIESGVTKECFEQVENFFALPFSEKMKIEQDENYRGYMKPYCEIDAGSTRPDSKECLVYGLEDDVGVQPCRGPNLWPDSRLLPDFKSAVTNYFDGALHLTKNRLMRLTAMSLGLDSTALDKFVHKPTAVLRPVHYFSEVSMPDQGMYACGEHTDYGFLTFIQTNGVDGLQLKLNDEWIDVPSVPGAAVVISGDMLELVSNGIYKAAVHRVVTDGTKRLSLILFLDPNMNVDLSPIPELWGSDGPKYEKTTFAEFGIQKIKAANLGYKGPGA